MLLSVACINKNKISGVKMLDWFSRVQRDGHQCLDIYLTWPIAPLSDYALRRWLRARLDGSGDVPCIPVSTNYQEREFNLRRLKPLLANMHRNTIPHRSSLLTFSVFCVLISRLFAVLGCFCLWLLHALSWFSMVTSVDSFFCRI